jgi:hypothetical protein
MCGHASRIRIDGVQPPKPFQAEYEGSIPFTRSKQFQALTKLSAFQGSRFVTSGRLIHRSPVTARWAIEERKMRTGRVASAPHRDVLHAPYWL